MTSKKIFLSLGGARAVTSDQKHFVRTFKWAALPAGLSWVLASQKIKATDSKGIPVKDLSAYDDPHEKYGYELRPSAYPTLAKPINKVASSYRRVKTRLTTIKDVSIAHSQQLWENIKALKDSPWSLARGGVIVSAPLLAALMVPRGHGLVKVKRYGYSTLAFIAASIICYPQAAWNGTKKTASGLGSAVKRVLVYATTPKEAATEVAKAAVAVETLVKGVEETAEAVEQVAEVIEKDIPIVEDVLPGVVAEVEAVVDEVVQTCETIEKVAEVVEEAAEELVQLTESVVENDDEQGTVVADASDTDLTRTLVDEDTDLAVVESTVTAPDTSADPSTVQDDSSPDIVSKPVKASHSADGLLLITTEGDKNFELKFHDFGQGKKEDNDLYTTRT